MFYIVLDIETIPSQIDGALEDIANELQPPANYKKEESIDRWRAENAEDVLHKTALLDTRTRFHGELVFIRAMQYTMIDYQTVRLDKNFSQLRKDGDDGELELLSNFTYWLDEWREPTLIGHNLIDFDLRFLWHRACALNYHKWDWARFLQTRVPGRIYDTMREWCGYRSMISLYNLAGQLGLSLREPPCSSESIARLWTRREPGWQTMIEAKADYDVFLTSDCWLKMTGLKNNDFPFGYF